MRYVLLYMPAAAGLIGGFVLLRRVAWSGSRAAIARRRRAEQRADMRRQLVVNGALLALALGTAGVVWVTREAPTTAQLASRKGKLLPTFDKEAVTRIVLSQERPRPGARAEPRPGQAGEFRIVKPWAERADVATVNQLLGSLDLASALRTADGVSPEQAA
jgi:hypothetical protein